MGGGNNPEKVVYDLSNNSGVLVKTTPHCPAVVENEMELLYEIQIFP